MRIIGTWWLQSNSPVCSMSWSHGLHSEAVPCSKRAKPDGSYFLSPISVWSPKDRTGYGTRTCLQRTTAGLRLVRAVKVDKRDHGSWLLAVGRLQGAVTVSLVTAGFGNATSTAVSISEQNAKHWHNHLVLEVWFGCVCVDSLQILWYQPEIASY